MADPMAPQTPESHTENSNKNSASFSTQNSNDSPFLQLTVEKLNERNFREQLFNYRKKQTIVLTHRRSKETNNNQHRFSPTLELIKFHGYYWAHPLGNPTSFYPQQKNAAGRTRDLI